MSKVYYVVFKNYYKLLIDKQIRSSIFSITLLSHYYAIQSAKIFSNFATENDILYQSLKKLTHYEQNQFNQKTTAIRCRILDDRSLLRTDYGKW